MWNFRSGPNERNWHNLNGKAEHIYEILWSSMLTLKFNRGWRKQWILMLKSLRVCLESSCTELRDELTQWSFLSRLDIVVTRKGLAFCQDICQCRQTDRQTSFNIVAWSFSAIGGMVDSSSQGQVLLVWGWDDCNWLSPDSCFFSAACAKWRACLPAWLPASMPACLPVCLSVSTFNSWWLKCYQCGCYCHMWRLSTASSTWWDSWLCIYKTVLYILQLQCKRVNQFIVIIDIKNGLKQNTTVLVSRFKSLILLESSC